MAFAAVPALAGVVSVIAVHAVGAVGGFQIGSYPPPSFASIAQVGQHLAYLVRGLLYLSGGHFFGMLLGVRVLPVLLRAAMAAGFLWAIGATCYRWLRGDAVAPLDTILALSAVVVLLAYVFSTEASSIATTRYLGPVYAWGAILLARQLAVANWLRVRPWLLAGGIGATVVLLALSPARRLRAGIPTEPPQQLAAWLSQHGLDYGYGSYWDASIVTAMAGGGEQVRPVLAMGGRILPFYWLSSASWYRQPAVRFLVFDGSDWGGVNAKAASATFGPPAAVHKVGPYTVLVWAHPLRPLS